MYVFYKTDVENPFYILEKFYMWRTHVTQFGEYFFKSYSLNTAQKRFIL